jgi:hypothetical protein
MDGAQIREITPEGLTYVDEEGKLQFIDFEACYQKHMTAFMKPEHLERYKEINYMTDEDLQARLELMKDWKEIGGRDLYGNPPYIEFYSDPPVRFEFADVNEFHRVRYLVHKGGWHTFDRG